ncbi:MAG: hypothetical protein NZ954_01035 [Thermofilaceae archaeon]|nr:hypothetical protein [Thermofilaceae archaeon]MCX8180546.1 hypothetical protein [Thermofilaceae archaeon]MDW8003258.1 hypothetical protein [Thermofilaceae archaeon]
MNSLESILEPVLETLENSYNVHGFAFTCMWIGVAGMVLILAGWVSSFNEVPPPKLSFLYAIGSALLVYHSLTVGDLVFTLLNSAATILSTVNLARVWLRKDRDTAINK